MADGYALGVSPIPQPVATPGNLIPKADRLPEHPTLRGRWSPSDTDLPVDAGISTGLR